MDSEQELRDLQREYLDFLDDDVSEVAVNLAGEGGAAGLSSRLLFLIISRRTRVCTMIACAR